MSIAIREYWQVFKRKHPEYSQSEYKEIYKFCDNEKDANECADLVVRGIKCATAASKWWHDYNEVPLPKSGEINIVVDWDDKPVAVIQVTEVNIVPFNQVSEEFAFTEGEGDKSLEYWKRVHWGFYTREMEPYGVKPSDDMLIVCEEFKLLS